MSDRRIQPRLDKRSTSENEVGAVQVTRPHPSLILARVEGPADSHLVSQLRVQVMREVDSKTGPNLAIDALKLSRCEHSVRDPFLEFLTSFKQAGGGRVAMAMSNPTVRLVFSAIAMTSPNVGGPRLILVDSLDSAYAKLEAKEGP